MKKYTLTKEEKVVFGVKLFRIQSLIEIESSSVVKGDFGGWVEKEENLSQEGGAWVSGEAQVSGGAQVFGGARIERTTEYFMIGPIGSRNSVMTAWKEKDGIKIATGCYLGAILDFKEKVKEVHGKSHHVKEYLAALKLITLRFGEGGRG